MKKEMNKTSKKLSLDTHTVRTLRDNLAAVVGGAGAESWGWVCRESHFATCGDGTRCATL